MKAIEVDFPFEQINAVAEMESWRKEIHRPIYYIHKWWAKRLGSVFRANVLGVLLEQDEDIWSAFYKAHHFEKAIILDPFMGSGTTLGECAKLGVRAIGCDINPISTFMVRQALTPIDEWTLKKTFGAIEADVKEHIQSYYKTLDPKTHQKCDVLYYFWVKVVKTPEGEEIPLFKNYVFSKNANPNHKPKAQILCPYCWTVNTGEYNTLTLKCIHCDNTFNPQQGAANEQSVISQTGKRYKIKDLIKNSGLPPKHRLYAIMAVDSQGQKIYLTPTTYDHELFLTAQKDFSQSTLLIPTLKLREGYNTKQAIGYGYQFWHQFFNERQLLCLSILLTRIRQIPEQSLREHFLCLFSSILELNNLFCSFKGEGTGAVRPLFSHHILKPEKTPLENNVWGTEKSSGTFLSLFKSRLLNAKKYLNAPFEIRLHENEGVKKTTKEICSPKMEVKTVDSYSAFINNQKAVLVINGDSAQLPIPNESVDAIVTDPPYFDFIHYSELSDFFYAWLQLALKDSYHEFQQENSSHLGEVQSKNPTHFSIQLSRVFSECFRVLKAQGLMVFSFHHGKPEAWLSLYQAITDADFLIVASHPVKAEMSVSKTKAATKNPINIDAIIVCKKAIQPTHSNSADEVWLKASKSYQDYCDRFWQVGQKLSNGDKYVIFSAQILVESSLANLEKQQVQQWLEKVSQLNFENRENVPAEVKKNPPVIKQMSLPFN